MAATNTEGWAHYKKLVLQRLDRHEEEVEAQESNLKEISEDIAEIKINLKEMRTYLATGVWIMTVFSGSVIAAVVKFFIDKGS